MNVAIMKTKAEQALSEAFEVVAAKLPGTDAVQKARAAAIGRFAAAGLPHRRIEEWKYTDLRANLKDAYPPAADGPVTLTSKDVDAALGPELAALDAVRIVFVNGVHVPALSRFDGDRNSSYYFDPLAKGLASSEFAWLKDRMSDASGPKKEAVVALNTAFARDGAILKVPAKAKLTKPIHLVFVSDGAKPVSIYTRNMVGVDEQADATVIESHVRLGDAARQANSVIEIAVHDGARLAHVKITHEGPAGQHVSTAVTELGRNANYRAFHMTSATGLVRNQLFVTFAGEGSKIDLSGAFLARGKEHVDTTLVVDHAVPRCESRELFKGVLDDQGRGVFQGKIIVRPDAQKTDGKQMSQVLMLSEDAEFDSKPELEIFADDVVCGHGTTSAQLDADLLFYCRSRGIPEKEARALMIESFVGEALEKVEHKPLREALIASATRWLAAKA